MVALNEPRDKCTVKLAFVTNTPLFKKKCNKWEHTCAFWTKQYQPPPQTKEKEEKERKRNEGEMTFLHDPRPQ